MNPLHVGASTLLGLLIALGSAADEPASVADAPRILPAGEVVEGRGSAGEVGTFAVGPADSDHLRIRLEQQGCDAVLRLHAETGAETRAEGDDGELELWADQPLGSHEPEMLLVPDGTYRLEVEIRSPGPYRLSWQPVPSSDPRVAGDRAWTVATDLYARDRPEDRQRAEEAFLDAADAWPDPDAAADRARALFVAAHLAADRGESEHGLALLERVLALRRASGDVHGQAEVHHLVGHIRRQRGEPDIARAALETSLELSTEAGDERGRARALLNLGFVDQQVGEADAARGRYEAALELAWSVGDPVLESKLLNNLAGLDFEAGELARAIGRFEALERLGRESDDLRSRIRTLVNLAAARRAVGRYQATLDAYGEALDLLEKLGDPRLEASTLNNLGFTHLLLGNPARAEEHLLAALDARRASGDRRGEGTTLNNLGLAALAASEAGNHTAAAARDAARAVELLERALAVRRQVEDARGEATTRHHLGRAERQRGRLDAARAHLEAALDARRRLGDAGRVPTTAAELAAVLLEQGELAEALPLADEAVDGHRRFGDRDGEVAALGVRAKIHRAQARDELALADAQRAIELVEALRLELRDPDARATLLGIERQVYELAIDLLVARSEAAGDSQAADAFALAERARARSLLEVLGGEPTSVVENRAEYRQLAEALAGLRHRADGLRRQGEEPPEALRVRIEGLSAELAALAAEGTEPPLDLDAFRALLDAQTRGLVFTVGEERSFQWTVGRGRARLRILPGRNELDARVQEVYGDFSTHDPRGAEAEAERAAELSQLLFGHHLPRAERLVIVPEGSLRYLPFAALPMPTPASDASGAAGAEVELLVDHKEVVYLPSASTLPALRRLAERPPASEGLVVLADPLYGDDLPRLASSGVEAERLAVIVGGRARVRTGAEASRAWVLDGGLGPHRWVHLAAHGEVDGRSAERSSLVLAQRDAEGAVVEGHLRATDVYGLELSSDLVVLSGCRTGLGQDVRGEGFLGLARAFFFAGAARVVSSQWRVDDGSTAELMTRFYRHLLGEGEPPSRALRRAQLELRRERRYRDPYHWAGFLLQGDWRAR